MKVKQLWYKLATQCTTDLVSPLLSLLPFSDVAFCGLYLSLYPCNFHRSDYCALFHYTSPTSTSFALPRRRKHPCANSSSCLTGVLVRLLWWRAQYGHVQQAAEKARPQQKRQRSLLHRTGTQNSLASLFIPFFNEMIIKVNCIIFYCLLYV